MNLMNHHVINSFDSLKNVLLKKGMRLQLSDFTEREQKKLLKTYTKAQKRLVKALMPGMLLRLKLLSMFSLKNRSIGLTLTSAYINIVDVNLDYMAITTNCDVFENNRVESLESFDIDGIIV